MRPGGDPPLSHTVAAVPLTRALARAIVRRARRVLAWTRAEPDLTAAEFRSDDVVYYPANWAEATDDGRETTVVAGESDHGDCTW